MKKSTPTVTVRALVMIDHKLLLVEHMRKDEKFFVLPGGGVEDHEDICSAAAREVREETHVKVKPLFIAYIRQIRVGKHSGIEFYVACEYVSGKPSLGHDPDKQDQVLASVSLADSKDLNSILWYPASLHDIATKALQKGFTKKHIIDLGIDIF